MSVCVDTAANPVARDVPEHRIDFTRARCADYCILIPVINEGGRLHRLLERMVGLSISQTADVIVVDGGSSDGSVDRSSLEAREVHTLLTKIGPGKLSAQLRCGYAHALDAGYAGVVTIDGNDKDDPAAIHAFVDALRGGIDFVQGSRFITGGMAENTPIIRELAIRWLHAPVLSLASGFRWTDTTQGFRAYSRRLLTDSRLAVFRNLFNDYELLAYVSYRAPRIRLRCIELPTTRRYPENGRIPTKISAVRGNLKLIRTLIWAAAGLYNPPG